MKFLYALCANHGLYGVYSETANCMCRYAKESFSYSLLKVSFVNI